MYKKVNKTEKSKNSYASGSKNPMLAISDTRRKSGDKLADSRVLKSGISSKARKIYSPSYKKRVKMTEDGKRKVAVNRGKYKPLKRKFNSRSFSKKIAKNKFTKKIESKDGILRIIPLGGCEEVGRNMTIFEYEEKGREKQKDIVILDMGLQFPEEDMPGIDYIIPNIDYLKGKEKNIRAVIFSHGHLDHIGAAPILLEKLGNPTIVGRPLTIEMIKHRQEDYKKGTSKNLKTIYIKRITDQIKLGGFNIKYFQVEHSVMDAVGVIFETKSGTVIHPGDWTLELDDNGKSVVDYSYLSNLKTPTILMLEALAATHQPGKKVTEKEMMDNLGNIIRKSPGRIIIATFASQIERIKQIIDFSSKLGKKVAIDGYSMKINMEIAERLGYLKINKNSLVSIKDISKYDDKRLVVLCTGAQGESNAVLSRIVNKNHKYINLKKSDTVVFSSSVIPGNERTIQRLKDNLYRLSDNVIHSDIMDVHVSGHGTVDDIRKVIKQIQPTYFIPVYANHYMLKEAAKVAIGDGFNPENILVPDNGSVIEFLSGNKPRVLSEKVNTDYVFVDGLGVGDISHVVLRDRKVMAEDGMIVVIVTIDKKTGQLVHSPDLISRGFIYMKENKRLVEDTRQRVKYILKKTDPKIEAFPDYIKNKIRNDVGQFLFKKIERRPMVLPVVIEV